MKLRYTFLAAALLVPGLAQAQGTCDIPALLEILSPSSIAGVYSAAPKSTDVDSVGNPTFGDTTGLTPPGLTGTIIHAEDPGDASIGAKPGEGCVPFTNAAAIAGNIALIRRGACEFGTKGFNAQAAGASGFIIYNDERVADDDTTILVPPFMGGGVQGPGVDIPGEFVARATGIAIIDELKFGVVTANMRYSDCWVVAIEPNPDGTPGTHALSEARPNPFNGRTAFSLEVAEAQDVAVEVYNTLGQRVAVLHEGVMAPGAAREFVLDAADLPAGVYLYRATGETFSETRSVVLTR